jgi:hypothetical protein
MSSASLYVAEIQSLGNPDRPPALWQWWKTGRIGVAELAELIPHAWEGPASPTAWLREEQWVSLFRAAGFIAEIDQRVSPLAFRVPPTDPVVVWRGAPTGAALPGMSWSPDIGTARTFFAKWRFAGEAGLYRVEVDPQAVLAVFSWPAEQEVVIDPTMVDAATVELVEVGASLEEIHPVFGRISDS